MNEDPKQERPRRPLISHDHQKRPLRAWVLPLLVVIAVIVLLPKLVALLEK